MCVEEYLASVSRLRLSRRQLPWAEQRDRVVTAEPTSAVETERAARRPVERRPFRLLPSVGRKGGERVTRTGPVEPK